MRLRVALLSSLAAPVLLIGGWLLAASLQPGDFDQVSDTISALAARGAEHRWVMTAAFIGTGLAHLVTATTLREAAIPGRLTLGLGGLATLGVAAAPLPVEGGSTAHGVTALVAFACLAVWPALAARDAAPLDRRTAVVASAVLLAELVWFVVELTGGGDRVGLSERVAAGSQSLWPLIAVLLCLRHARMSP